MYLTASHFFPVSGKENPSDCLSRGQLLDHPLCLNGPSWIKEPISQWPLDHFVFDEQQDVPEIRIKAQTFITTKEDEPFLHKLAARFSSWTKLLHVVVFMFRFIKKIPRSELIAEETVLFNRFILAMMYTLFNIIKIHLNVCRSLVHFLRMVYY